MLNYDNGKIYKIISDQSDKIYIGSTTKKYLSSRLASHVKNFKAWKKGSYNKYVSSYEILEYEDHKIILIESYPCKTRDELRSREQYWIEKFKDLCVNMYFAYGGTKGEMKRREYIKHKDRYVEYHKEYHIKNSNKINERAKEYQSKNNDKIKQKVFCLYCGNETRKTHLARHNQSQKHINNVEYFQI